jgi:hypothetical protein
MCEEIRIFRKNYDKRDGISAKRRKKQKNLRAGAANPPSATKEAEKAGTFSGKFSQQFLVNHWIFQRTLL